MKVAFIKQVLDVHGPLSSVKWNDDPLSLFEVWPGKATLWAETCILKADWYVIPQQIITAYTIDAVKKHNREKILLERSVTAPLDEIPFEDYDLVVTMDPILDKELKPVHAYRVIEHWDELYTQSLEKPLPNRDLFLAHMLDAPKDFDALPASISFPYLYDPELFLECFGRNKKNFLWVDWRTFTALGGEPFAWSEKADRAVEEFTRRVDFPIRFKNDRARLPYTFSETGETGDAARYLSQLAECKFYVGVGRKSGAGQGLCDAAALGCICIGDINRPYHRLVCHPECLCSNLREVYYKVNYVIDSAHLHQEILQWQFEGLKTYFLERPLALLKKAVELKSR